MGLGLAHAASMPQLPFIPTRFQLCSQELASLTGDDRAQALRDCLIRRFHAEKIVRQDCAQSVKQMRPAPQNSDDRYRARRQCFIDHLTASYKDLPDNGRSAVAARTGAPLARKHANAHDDTSDADEVSSAPSADTASDPILPPGSTPPATSPIAAPAAPAPAAPAH